MFLLVIYGFVYIIKYYLIFLKMVICVRQYMKDKPKRVNIDYKCFRKQCVYFCLIIQRSKLLGTYEEFLVRFNIHKAVLL